MKRTIIVVVLYVFAITTAAAQQPEQQQQQQEGPCVHGNTRAIMAGVDITEMHCQLEMVARRLGMLEFEVTQLQAKNSILQNDLDAAEKAKSATKPDVIPPQNGASPAK